MKNLSLFFAGHKALRRDFVAKVSSLPDNRQAFLEAFIPDPNQPPTSTNITTAWIEQASVAIDALVEFRSAIHRWRASGQVPDSEFVTEAERLRLAKLAGWFDHLMAVGLAADAIIVIKDDGRKNNGES